MDVESKIQEQKISGQKGDKEEKEIVRLLLNYGNEQLKIGAQTISIASLFPPAFKRSAASPLVSALIFN